MIAVDGGSERDAYSAVRKGEAGNENNGEVVGDHQCGRYELISPCEGFEQPGLR